MGNERQWTTIGIVEETVYRLSRATCPERSRRESRDWTRRKGLPAHRVGKLWKFKTEEVDEWVKSGKANESLNKAR